MKGTLNLFPSRVPIGSVVRKAKDATGREIEITDQVMASVEFLRALTDLFERVGGAVALDSTSLALLAGLSVPVPAGGGQDGQDFGIIGVSAPAAPDDTGAELSAALAAVAVLTRRVEALEAQLMPAATPPDWENPGSIGRATPNKGTFTKISLGGGSVGAPSVYFSVDSASGFYRIGTDHWGFSVAGVKLFELSVAGATFTENVTTSKQLVSTLADGGAAPLVVTSKTLVSNLYVDRSVIADTATVATNALRANKLNNPTTLPAAATDLATVITLANNLRDAAIDKQL